MTEQQVQEMRKALRPICKIDIGQSLKTLQLFAEKYSVREINSTASKECKIKGLPAESLELLRTLDMRTVANWLYCKISNE